MDAQESSILVQHASQGDVEAIETLLGRHLPGLYAFVRLRTGRALRAKESVSDLVQSVCRDVLQNQERYRYPGDEQFRKWLFTTALRKISNRQDYYLAAKRDARREQGTDDLVDSKRLMHAYASLCTPSQHAIAHEQLERIQRAFEALRDDYRDVILKSRLLGMSHEEIGEEMDRTPGAVRTLLSRALAQLAERIEVEESRAPHA